MTRAIVLLNFIAFLLLSTTLFAAKKKVDGYYVRPNSTKKFKATFLIPGGGEPNYIKMQTEITYLLDGREQLFTPEDVDEIFFTYKGKDVLMRSVYNNLTKYGNGQPVFCHVVQDGFVSLLHYYEQHMSGSTGFGVTSYTQVHEALQRDRGELAKIRDLYFKKDTCDFFADCSELVASIKSGSLTDLAEMVRRYNNCF